MPNALFVVMDGLGDRGRETPLSKAKTPNLDKIGAELRGGVALYARSGATSRVGYGASGLVWIRSARVLSRQRTV